jgi:citrate lyase subunit beta/citryl-CoA lyase
VSPRRSCLAVPASDPRMMEKAAASAADQVFLDLEDACAPSQKKSSRALAVEALLTHDFGAKIRVVRVNDVTTGWCHGDVIEVVTGAGSELDAIMLPKVEDASHVHFVDHLLTGLERDLGLSRRIGLELQIESPLGVVNIREISRASARTQTIIFGPGDYSASLGVAQLDIGMVDARYPGHQLHWVMSEIANHARAAGLDAIDGPYVDFTDGDSYKDAATRARLLGFDGKWCIHPNQIPWANEAFTPSTAEIAAAERIVAAYRQAADEGLGALAVDGKLVDEASRKIAEGILERAGQVVTPSDA